MMTRMTGAATDPSGACGRWLGADASAALVRAAQAGTARDLDVLLGRLRPLLFGYFAQRVDAVSADDLTQRALLIIARQYRRVDPIGASRWLVTVARNIARDEFRRTSRAALRRAPESDALAIPVPGSTSAHAEYRELVHAIVSAANATCTASLRAVVLGLMRGLEVSEIARELGVSEPAVRVRLARARPLLRRELQRFW
jgi:RNA polymerase sigma-70 factor (ECF subfamily)